MPTADDRGGISRFIRVGGSLLFWFGVLAMALRLVQFFLIGDPPLEELVLTDEFLLFQGAPSLVVAVFFLIGATALYIHQAEDLGWIGLITYFVSFSMLVLSSGAMWTYAFTAPELAREAPQLLTSPSSGIVRSVIASMAFGQIGWLLLVLVSFRSTKLPRWSLWISTITIFLAMALASFAQTQLFRLIFNILLGCGPLVIGFVLWRGAEGRAVKDARSLVPPEAGEEGGDEEPASAAVGNRRSPTR